MSVFLIAAFAAGCVLMLTLLPWIRTGHWVARVCDFPRMQLAGLMLVPAGLLVVDAVFGEWGRGHWVLGGVCVLVIAHQLWHVVPYTRLWRREVRSLVEPRARLRVLIANLDFTNEQRAGVLRAISDADTDLLLLIEIDRAWDEALEPLAEAYPHRAGCVEPDGLGLVLLSRIPLRDAEVRHLVSDARPSIHTTVETDDIQPIRIVALHPTPPGLKSSDGERHDSRKRDAELLLLAEDIETSGTNRWVVLGDLNDVAWSRTTRQFRRISAMRDPRIGRALLNTFHAQYPLLRYPLDHLFLSEVFGISRLERLRLPGSDHFGVLATIDVPWHEDGDEPAPPESGVARDASRDDADEIIEDGLREAEDEER